VISPDQCHDMHGRASTPSDPCDFSQVQSLIATGDAFLQNTVSAIMNSRAWTGNSVIFITWDESDFTGSGFQGFGDDSGCCDSVLTKGRACSYLDHLTLGSLRAHVQRGL